ncbi:MAG: metallophosphoesterase [Candidatus Sumerlaeota bacterium]|nr:metallophosphoesterase [Candidatus Sumerlaeota bacterium]
MERREFLRTVAGAGAGALVATSCARFGLYREKKDVNRGASGGFSFAHITDQHVQAKRAGDKGYLKCIESVNDLRPQPDFAVMGGDMPFDGNYNTKEKFITDTKLFRDISNELAMPWFPCMGNHDVLGWHPRRKVAVSDPDLGKKCIMDLLEWPSSYYSFDYGGWHFVVLDCIKGVVINTGPSHVCEVDAEQLEWLAGDLGAAAGRPAVVFSHVAVFCNEGQIQGSPDARAMSSMVINNNRALRLILERHGVKALVQGHSHWIEDFYFNDVWYVTSAAASAAWWAGIWTGSDFGYTVFSCKGDRLTWEHKTFKWEPHLESADDLERKKNKEWDELHAEQRRLRDSERLRGRTLIPKPLPKQNAHRLAF